MVYPESPMLITTRTGFKFQIRPANADDDAMVREFFRHVTSDDLRFRFLSGMKKVSLEQIQMLTHPDQEYTESVLALTEDGATMIATGMLACDKTFDRGEVAIATHGDYKNKGVSWELLAHIARLADAKGLNTLELIESRANHDAIELARDMGFESQEYPGDASLMLLRRTGKHS